MKLLLDMNLSPSWVDFLTAAGVEARHWSTIGERDAPDADLMGWAREHGHVVFTNDLDFSALLALTRADGPSVVQVRLQDLLPMAIGDVVLRLLSAHEFRPAGGRTRDAVRERHPGPDPAFGRERLSRRG